MLPSSRHCAAAIDETDENSSKGGDYVVDTITLLPSQPAPLASRRTTTQSRDKKNDKSDKSDKSGETTAPSSSPAAPAELVVARSAALHHVMQRLTAAEKNDTTVGGRPSKNPKKKKRLTPPYHVGVLLCARHRRARLAFVVTVKADGACRCRHRGRRCGCCSLSDPLSSTLHCSQAYRVGVHDVLKGARSRGQTNERTNERTMKGGGGDDDKEGEEEEEERTNDSPWQRQAVSSPTDLETGRGRTRRRKVDVDAEEARTKGPTEPLRYETPNFLVLHPNYDVAEPNPLCEMYLSELYKEFKREFLDMLRAERLILVDRATGEDIPQKVAFCTDVLSFFVLQNYSRRRRNVAAVGGTANPFFSDDAQYDINTVFSLVGRDLAASEEGHTARTDYSDGGGGAVERFERVLVALEARSRDYNRRYAQVRDALLGMDYTFAIDHDGIAGNVNIKLLLVPGAPPPPPGVQAPGAAGPASRPSGRHLTFDNKEVRVRDSVFRHLVRSYNIANFEDHAAVEPLDALDFYEKVFILYYRYFAFDSGKNQSSILPAFKMVLKRLLNIKVELFGSAINTSSRFGSLFYDVERYFGSLGNFFDLDVRRGYFEVNPPYDDVIVDGVFRKLTKWLYASAGNSSSSAANNERVIRNSAQAVRGPQPQPLLFFVVLPKRDYRRMPSFASLAPFVKRYEVVPKERFPFLRYDRTLTKTHVSPIVDVILLILHNDQIDDVNKEIVRTWNSNTRFRLRSSSWSSPSPSPLSFPPSSPSSPLRQTKKIGGGGGRRSGSATCSPRRGCGYIRPKEKRSSGRRRGGSSSSGSSKSGGSKSSGRCGRQ